MDKYKVIYAQAFTLSCTVKGWSVPLKEEEMLKVCAELNTLEKKRTSRKKKVKVV